MAAKMAKGPRDHNVLTIVHRDRTDYQPFNNKHDNERGLNESENFVPAAVALPCDGICPIDSAGGPMERAACERLAQETILAGRLQLQPRERHQRTRNVAGGDLRPRDD